MITSKNTRYKLAKKHKIGKILNKTDDYKEQLALTHLIYSERMQIEEKYA